MRANQDAEVLSLSDNTVFSCLSLLSLAHVPVAPTLSGAGITLKGHVSGFILFIYFLANH